jgi:7-carboxy-7-deazaguanine synthase
MNYKIAEHFHSLQGEGVYTGTPMHFIRLAGCNVGKFYFRPDWDAWPQILAAQVLQHGKIHSVCTSALGQMFQCDTDYKMRLEVPHTTLVDDTYEGRVCLTGGEPLIHDIMPLVTSLVAAGKRVHIETSGTCPIPAALAYLAHGAVWITCSPKKGYLSSVTCHVSEFKFVVSYGTPDFIDRVVPQIVALTEGCQPNTPVYLQPINSIGAVDYASLAFVQQVLLHKGRDWRLSVQLHKLLGIR